MSAPRLSRAVALFALLALLAGLTATGCGRRAAGPPRVAGGPPGGEEPGAAAAPAGDEAPGEDRRGEDERRDQGPRPAAGYERRVESLAVDTRALAGRRIVLDPGHGGRFPGSIGPRGLTEAEVNLGVALHLWGLLVDAGAEVMLTRTADRDFTAPGDSSLRGDLERRMARANAFDPDAFLSIHHNADAGGRNDRNEIQTYYRFTDPFASLDLAEALHRHLKTNLAIEADRVLPGNYSVLRNAAAPAVLGESSYLTNPDVEARLALAAKQRLEAEAYFLGFATYFRSGVPRLEAPRLVPASDVVAAARGAGSNGTAPDPRDASERPWLSVVSDLAPGEVRLAVDGVPVDGAQIERRRLAGDSTRWELRWRPPAPFTDGRHSVTWRVRAEGGNWSKAKSDTFAVDLPIARMALDVAPTGGLAAGQLACLTLTAFDRHGRPVADTLSARFRARVGAVLVDSLAPAAAGPGQARAYARVTGGSAAAFAVSVLAPPPAPGLVPGERLVPLAETAGGITGFVRTPAGRGVAGAIVRADSLPPGAAAADTAGVTTNAEGFFAFPVAGARLSVHAPGYVAARRDRAATGLLAVLPVAGGALAGRRIALDPGDGGPDTSSFAAAAAGSDDDSTSAARAALRSAAYAADASLRVARALREYLEAAGAVVLLTRDAPESLAAVERLRRIEAFEPERALVLARRAPGNATLLGHYYSSANGRALAGRAQRWLEKRDVPGGARVIETPDWIVQQTGAVALRVDAPRADALYRGPDRGAARLRAEAYALYLALAEDLGGDPAGWESVTVRVSHDARPEAGVPVELDGRWILFSDSAGRVRFDGLPPGAGLALAAGDLVATGLADRPPSRGGIVRSRITTPQRDEVGLDLGAATPAPGGAPAP